MFENATTIHLLPGMVGHALTLLRAEVVPVLKSQEGFINLCLLPRHAAHSLTIISLWSSHTQARAAEAAGGYRRAIARLDALLAEGAHPARQRPDAGLPDVHRRLPH